jgi:toxin ParE1/3/4
MSVQLLPEARIDLAGIHRFTRRHFGARQADKYVAGLWDICRLIEDRHLVGRDEEAVHRGLFSYRVRAHRLFYRWSVEGGLIVVRILHDSMNFKDHL